MLDTLHKTGLSSKVMYTMGLASIGASVAAWVMSRNAESSSDIDRADRWGIFVGLWAPTFLSLGCAIRLEEQTRALDIHNQRETNLHQAGDRSRESTPVAR